MRLLISNNDSDNVIIISVSDSMDLEKELFCRIAAMHAETDNSAAAQPAVVYVGVFAGISKPKPSRRKRAYISMMPEENVTELKKMREVAIRLHSASYNLSPANYSLRHQLAMQFVVNGFNEFALGSISGRHSAMWTTGSVIQMRYESINLCIAQPASLASEPQVIVLPFSGMSHWNIIDNGRLHPNESGIDVFLKSGDHWYFSVIEIYHFQHTLEYFWNRYAREAGLNYKPGSTNGRTMLASRTLSGIGEAYRPPSGIVDIVLDDVGNIVYSLQKSLSNPLSCKLGPENRWGRSIVHQGWLLKKVGAVNREWTRRYFVIYSTPQGHFLVYYRSCLHTPLFSTEMKHCNIIDLSRVVYVRPVSAKDNEMSIPPFPFDIITVDREWTLCANSTKDLKVRLILLPYFILPT